MRLLSILVCLLGTIWCYEVEKITDPLLLGEGPHWNAETQLLYFVDITNSTIHLYDPLTQVHNYTYIDGGAVTFIIPIAGTADEFLVSTDLDIRHVIWDGEQDSTVTSSILYSALQDSDGSRFNDAKVDKSGHLWAGSMGPELIANVITERTGRLYRVSPCTGITAYIEDILISNGLAWNADGSIMYYTDTGDLTVDTFDFDASADPPLTNRQVIYNFTENGILGNTDGMTIDTDGNLWLACYSGYQVIKVNPNNGSLLMSIPINASQVTSVTWGGAELDDLYVTTAKKGLSDEELTNYPDSGATYRITGLDARGYPGDNYIMYKATTSSSLILTTLPLFSFSVLVLLLSCSHGNLSFVIPITGTRDEFLVSTNLDIRHLVWDGQQESTPTSSILYSALQASDGSKFNDAKVDRSGNLWAGTMGPEIVLNEITERTGKLYRLSRFTGITAYIENILISNGLAWSADGSIMYYIDSGDMTVDYFDYDASAEPPLSVGLTIMGMLSGNRRVAFNFTSNGIIAEPDGMAIDTDGNLWVGCFNGYQVLKVNPNNGTVLMSIPIDAPQVTSVAWGGADLDELYVTTAQKGLSEEEQTNYPDSGATWRITGLDARGYAGNSYPMYSTSSSSISISTTLPLFIFSLTGLLLSLN